MPSRLRPSLSLPCCSASSSHGRNKVGEGLEAFENVVAHGRGLAGELDQRIEQETAALKNSRAQIILQTIFEDPVNPPQRVRDMAHALENHAFPNPDAFIIDRIPDFFLVAEVAVQATLGEAGGFNDAGYGGIEVSLDREELHGFFQDMLAGQVSFGSHL